MAGKLIVNFLAEFPLVFQRQFRTRIEREKQSGTAKGKKDQNKSGDSTFETHGVPGGLHFGIITMISDL